MALRQTWGQKPSHESDEHITLAIGTIG